MHTQLSLSRITIVAFATLAGLSCVVMGDDETPGVTRVEQVQQVLPQGDSTMHQKLGVNFTWASDSRITGDPAFASLTPSSTCASSR